MCAPAAQDATVAERLALQAEVYLSTHVKLTAEHNRPLVLTAFSSDRDDETATQPPGRHTTVRDEFFSRILAASATHMKKKNHGALAGVIFWSWAGEGRAVRGRAKTSGWFPGDPFTGDPPSEPQGAFSVFDSDDSTISVLSRFGLSCNAQAG